MALIDVHTALIMLHVGFSTLAACLLLHLLYFLFRLCCSSFSAQLRAAPHTIYALKVNADVILGFDDVLQMAQNRSEHLYTFILYQP